MRTLGIVLLAGTVLACAGESRPIELRVGLDPAATTFGEVEVWGLPPAIRKGLARMGEQDTGWSRALTIKATGETGEVPPLPGRYRVDPSGCLKFSPRYTPEGPLSYRVRLDPGALVKLAGVGKTSDTVQQWLFRLPGKPLPPPTTTITAVYPTASVIPANQLRWYVEFSAPMREGEARGVVQLLDARGRAVEGAFLRREEELWNPDRTRLTLLFDMARVKHMIRRRLEAGPVLRAGRRYTLKVSEEWHDARGAKLVGGFEHRFTAGPEDFRPVAPEKWRLEPPMIGSRAPLELDFGRSLDHALAGRFIAVTGPDATPVPGSITLVEDDRRWRFVPDRPWLAGRYRIQVHPALEDVAGNRVGHPFDAKLDQGESAGVKGQPTILEFMPLGEAYSFRGI